MEPRKDRLTFIDVMRGIAVVWMIETHVIDVVLNEWLKKGAGYGLLNISNGFVAVSFIFCAGAGFWLAAQKKVNDYKEFKPPLWIYLRRLMLILIIGYCLHLPTPSLSGLFDVPTESWMMFYESDILQCIVYTSLISLVLLLVIPRLNIVPLVFGVLAFAVFFISPWIWSWNSMSSLPAFLGALFAEPPISKFPLFPWSGYFFGGVALTALFMQSKNKSRLSWLIILSGFAISAMMINFKLLGTEYPEISNWWKGSPGHSLFRFFGTVGVFGLLYLTEKYYKNNMLGKHLRIAGQESLFLYVSHLLIVYNSMNMGIDFIFGTSLNYMQSLLIFVLITLICYAGAYYWHKLKANNIKRARFVMTVTFSVLIFFFIIT